MILDILEHTEGYVDYRSEEEKKNGVPIASVVVNAFLDSAVEIKFPIQTTGFAEYYAVAPKIREQILVAFRENHIEIPYPVTTVIQKKDS